MTEIWENIQEEFTMNIVEINTPLMQQQNSMKELVESICHWDCQYLERGITINNPYDKKEPEYKWYKDYARRVFNIIAE